MSSRFLNRRTRRFLVPLLTLLLVGGLGLLIKISLPRMPSVSSHHSAQRGQATKPSTVVKSTVEAASKKAEPARTPDPIEKASDARDAELGKLAAAAEKQNKQLLEPPKATFKVASFNILGHSHTSGRRPRKGYGSAGSRMGGVVALLRSHGIDVVGLQEFQPSQARQFGATAREYAVYPPIGTGGYSADNSVAYKRDVFTLVQGGTRPYPYFGGVTRHMPEIVLQHKVTGVKFTFTSYHNAANVGGNQTRHRHRAVDLQAANANANIAAKMPLIITGDMNDRAQYFCSMAGRSAMHAANGGSVSGGCRPPGDTQIDWVMGSPLVEFSDYLVDRSSKGRRISDHNLIVAVATVTGDPRDRPQATD